MIDRRQCAADNESGHGNKTSRAYPLADDVTVKSSGPASVEGHSRKLSRGEYYNAKQRRFADGRCAFGLRNQQRDTTQEKTECDRRAAAPPQPDDEHEPTELQYEYSERRPAAGAGGQQPDDVNNDGRRGRHRGNDAYTSHRRTS